MKFLIKIPDIVTLLNLVCGLFSIKYSIQGEFLFASIFLLMAVFFDYIDGKLARLMKIESKLGSNLDSLSDLVSFGVAPAFFVFLLFNNILIFYISIIFVCAGTYRLAKFNVIKKKTFEGMPITLNGILFPIFYFINANIYLYFALLIISSILMISKIKINRL